MLQTINFNPGDIIQVYQKISEGEKTRIQIFEGTVLGIKGRGENKMYTVRKVIDGIAVEKIFPVFSPSVEKVVVKGHQKRRVRRAKLTFMRNSIK